MDRERRRFGRVAYRGPCRVILRGERWAAHCEDLGIGGVRLELPPDAVASPGERVAVVMPQDGRSGLRFAGRIQWVRSAEAGVGFTLIPLESLSFARQVVRYNTKDSERVAEDLRALVSGCDLG